MDRINGRSLDKMLFTNINQPNQKDYVLFSP